MNKPRVVITGAAGFIGSHLAEALLDLKIMWLTVVKGFFHKHAY